MDKLNLSSGNIPSDLYSSSIKRSNSLKGYDSFASATGLNKKKKVNRCHICFQQFGLRVKKKQCSVCQLLVCKNHAQKKDEKFVCDQCTRQEIQETISSQHRILVSQLKQELKQEHRLIKEKKALIERTNNRILKLKQKKRSCQQIYTIGLEKLKKQAEGVYKINEDQTAIANQIRKALILKKSQQEQKMQSLDQLKNAWKALKQQQGELALLNEEEAKKILQNFQKLNRQVTIDQIKHLVCQQCYNKSKFQLQKRLYPDIAARQTPSKQKHKTCASCVIF